MSTTILIINNDINLLWSRVQTSLTKLVTLSLLVANARGHCSADEHMANNTGDNMWDKVLWDPEAKVGSMQIRRRRAVSKINAFDCCLCDRPDPNEAIGQTADRFLPNEVQIRGADNSNNSLHSHLSHQSKALLCLLCFDNLVNLKSIM